MSDVPEKVNEVLKAYLDLFERKLPNLLKGYYIYGSVSLGAFNYGLSDIDFIAVIERKVNKAEIDILKEIHGNIKKRFSKTDLMGIYVTKSDLKAQNENEESCPCFIDGKYKGMQKFKKDSIDAYQLKKYGISIKGPEIESFEYTVNWDVLINSMIHNLNTYWANWKDECCRFPSIKYFGLFNMKMIEWGVLGVSRLYYTFKENDITSKIGAGEYALKTVSQRWHRIINESMRLRKGIKKSFYKSIIERRKDTLEYIEFIINEGNNLFNARKQ